MQNLEFIEFFKQNKQNGSFSFAPGRIEFLGNHLDYNGGDVLGMAVNAGVYCLGVPTDDNTISLFSENIGGSRWLGSVDGFTKQSGNFSWTNYCLGVVKELQNQNLAPKNGFHLLFSSDLPTSVGLSSSAALELATAHTLLQLAGNTVERDQLANICRKAENDFVGMPCGILDQGTSAFGKKNNLVCIDCDQNKFSNLALPPDTEVWIFNTRIKHDLVDSLYSTRHKECQEVLNIVQSKFPEINLLTECNPSMLDATEIPENLKKRGLHVIEEQNRVRAFKEGLESNLNLAVLGSYLADSHASSSDKFENSCSELDFLADQLNSHKSVLGARLTGGGFGGAVMAWTRDSFSENEAVTITENYKNHFKQQIDFHQFRASDGVRTAHLYDENPFVTIR